MEKTLENESHRKLAIFLLILITISWGSTFIITKTITNQVPVHFFLGLRFLLALIPFIPFLPHLKQINLHELKVGLLAGVIYFFSILVQTYGLQTTTAGKGGFITGLNTVIVPFLAWLGFHKKIEKRIWMAVVLSCVGMGFLLLEGESAEVFIGDLLVLLCAFGFAFYIIYVDRDVHSVDIYNYLIIQLTVIMSMSFLFSGMLQEEFTVTDHNAAFWLIMLYMGAIAGGLTFFIQNWGEKQVGAAQTAIIFTLEPVFAVFFGFLLGGEILTILGWLGCILIFIAIIITVVKKERNQQPSQ